MTDDRDRIEGARMALTQAVTRSQAAAHGRDADGRATGHHVGAAAVRLRRGGRADLARRLEAIDDATSSEGRAELRDVISLLDAELSPAVVTSGFVAASDGGARE